MHLSDVDRSPSQVTVSMYEEVVHPNEEKSEQSMVTANRRPSYLLGAPQQASWQTSAFVNWFVNFDETKLRPFLIRNYTL